MTMRCLYEVLSVDKAADDDTIKKAYRKAALIWHPGVHIVCLSYTTASGLSICAISHSSSRRADVLLLQTATAAAVLLLVARTWN
jgi:hypothetical protein